MYEDGHTDDADGWDEFLGEDAVDPEDNILRGFESFPEPEPSDDRPSDPEDDGEAR